MDLEYVASLLSLRGQHGGLWAHCLAARLPFALLGFLAFILAFVLFKKLALKDSLTPYLALSLLACNVPWLLFMRQCRYYSPLVFGVLAAISTIFVKLLPYDTQGKELD